MPSVRADPEGPWNLCLEPFASAVTHRDTEQVVLGVLKNRCLLIIL